MTRFAEHSRFSHLASAAGLWGFVLAVGLAGCRTTAPIPAATTPIEDIESDTEFASADPPPRLAPPPDEDRETNSAPVPTLLPVFDPMSEQFEDFSRFTPTLDGDPPDHEPNRVRDDPLPPLTLPPVPASSLASEPPPPSEPVVGPVKVGSRLIPSGELGQLTPVPVWTGPTFPAGGCATCGTGGCNQCEPFPRTGFASRLVGIMYDVLCCPDPCYQPKWEPLVDTAFFSDSPRPVSQTRLRWEYSNYAHFPDRAEFLWARSDGNGKGPRPVGAAGIPRVDYHELSQYTETAAGPGFSAFVITPYRSVNPTFSDPPSAAGFSDISLGTKSVLFDRDLCMLTLQFKTTLPVGQPRKGLGTGHVSLEPSLLFGLRTSPNSYIQGQVAEWIPIAGDPQYAGAVLHYHLGFNHTLWQPIQAVQLVGTLEFHGYSFQDGGFTDPDGGFRRATGTNILQVGPGLRLFFCDQYDFGVGTNFGITGKNSISEVFRAELRVRY